MSVIYARLTDRYIFKNRKVFPGKIDEQDEDNQVFDENALYIILNYNQNLTESNIDNIDIEPPLEHRIQNQKIKQSGWSFYKNISRTT